MKNPLKACTCSQCKARKRDMNTNFKKKIRKLLNKKLRKMDITIISSMSTHLRFVLRLI